MGERSIHRVRTRTLLAAGLAALCTAEILAGSGSAQSGPTTLHLVTQEQPGIGFAPKGPPSQGGRIGFGQKISGDDHGYSRELCTFIGNVKKRNPNAKLALCTEQLQLSGGTLTAQGLLAQRDNEVPLAITGGTGAYDGARGTALSTDVSRTKTRITVELLR